MKIEYGNRFILTDIISVTNPVRIETDCRLKNKSVTQVIIIKENAKSGTRFQFGKATFKGIAKEVNNLLQRHLEFLIITCLIFTTTN